MLSLSPVKLLIVAVIAMLLLGPDKLPQVARQLGAAWRSFRTFQQKIEQEVRESLPDLPKTGDLAKMARSPVALLNQLAEMPSLDLEPAVPDTGAELPDQLDDDTPWPSDTAASADDDWLNDAVPRRPGSSGRLGSSGRRAMSGRSEEAPPPDWSSSEGIEIPNDPSMN